ncbi:hypothetical protein WN875_08795 [Tetragenococcus halophilus]|uniref:replication-relaxation family protein n=1 Tax=Tetragenococcus halophilus TaxID=51669 RepID=UPI0030F306DB
MNKRDKQILNDLQRFRVLGRDDIVDLYFSHLKNPVTCANTVLKRLVRDKQIEVSKHFTPYVYFLAGSGMKKNSTKIPHFLKLVEVYKQVLKYERVETFIVEPKYNKGLAEPDIFMVIKGTPFFVEVQRNVYSQKVMNQKIKRYEDLYYSNEFKKFPFVIMISDTKYDIKTDLITFFQEKSIYDFMEKINKRKKEPKPIKEIRYKLG